MTIFQRGIDGQIKKKNAKGRAFGQAKKKNAKKARAFWGNKDKKNAKGGAFGEIKIKIMQREGHLGK